MTNMICCKTCRYCKYIRTPQITGRDIDYVCERKGSIIDDITIKNCDEMYVPREMKKERKNDS